MPSSDEMPRGSKEPVSLVSNAVHEDVDYIEEDVQSRVSKPLVRYLQPSFRRNPLKEINNIQWLLIVLTILSSTFLFSLDNTVVADVQSPVVKTFDEVGKLSWLGVGFVLASSSTLITW